MNWQETVLSREDIHRFPRTSEELKEALLDQAEASYSAGIREVVEWLRQQRCRSELMHYCPNCDHSIYGVNEYELEAKLKDWGIHQASRREGQ